MQTAETRELDQLQFGEVEAKFGPMEPDLLCFLWPVLVDAEGDWPSLEDEELCKTWWQATIS